MKIFGSRKTEDNISDQLAGKKLTRFARVHERERPTPPARAERTVRTLPDSVIKTPSPLLMQMRQAETVDPLHSETGLNPSILRNALPNRFRKLNEAKRPALGEDFFARAAAGA